MQSLAALRSAPTAVQPRPRRALPQAPASNTGGAPQQPAPAAASQVPGRQSCQQAPAAPAAASAPVQHADVFADSLDDLDALDIDAVIQQRWPQQHLPSAAATHPPRMAERHMQQQHHQQQQQRFSLSQAQGSASSGPALHAPPPHCMQPARQQGPPQQAPAAPHAAPCVHGVPATQCGQRAQHLVEVKARLCDVMLEKGLHAAGSAQCRALEAEQASLLASKAALETALGGGGGSPAQHLHASPGSASFGGAPLQQQQGQPSRFAGPSAPFRAARRSGVWRHAAAGRCCLEQ